VLVTHAALANHVRHFAALFDLGPGDRVPVMSPVAFDVATEEMLPPLVAGCTSIVTRARYADIEELADDLAEQRCSVLNLRSSDVALGAVQVTAPRRPAPRASGGPAGA
jgi:non-ribosomal peptide synthetase component F